MLIRPQPEHFRPPSIAPFVAIVEDRLVSRGPDAFDLPALRVVTRRAQGIMVLTRRPTIRDYALMASVISAGVTVMMIETGHVHGQDWRDFVHATAPTASIIVR
ncbi:hypothetical protein FPV16_21845 [Methylobacterium sp. W2]|uniref:hypothetical protein n=1 Tax=Methylobacterium sp. W2 TaxID=2598107 RepID=UPI001D0C2C73|nr:hypothetical protein [Methylobacterium sp. W2]MCC0808815.1 hypothetical protein [Methylobacterium sp. W2]